MAGRVSISEYTRHATDYQVTEYVRMKVQLPAGGIVERRYKHFLWLKDALLKFAPGIILPPFPRETGTDASRGLDNSSDAFVKKRMAALALFLNRVLDRDDLCDSAAVTVFCTAPFDDFSKLTAALDAKEAEEIAAADAQAVDAARANGDIGSSIMSSDDSGSQNWSRYGDGATTDGGAAAAPVEKKSGWFSSLSSQLPSLSSSLTSLATSVARSAAGSTLAEEYTPADLKISDLSSRVKESEADALASFRAMHGLTNARIECCSEAVRWADAVVGGVGATSFSEDSSGGSSSGESAAGTTSTAAAEAEGEAHVDAVKTDSNSEQAAADARAGQAPAMGETNGIPQGCAPGVSGRLIYFGLDRQRQAVMAAKSEHAIFSKAFKERLGTLAAVKDALESREALRKQLVAARSDLAAKQAALADARGKEGAAATTATAGTGAGVQLLALEREKCEVAKVKAAARVERLKQALALATTRVAHGWTEASETWNANLKATLLEAVYANHRLSQMPVAALQALHRDLLADHAKERAAAETEEAAEAAAAAAMSDITEGNLVNRATEVAAHGNNNGSGANSSGSGKATAGMVTRDAVLARFNAAKAKPQTLPPASPEESSPSNEATPPPAPAAAPDEHPSQPDLQPSGSSMMMDSPMDDSASLSDTDEVGV